MNFNWKFQEGKGSNEKNLPWGGMDIFWNHTIYMDVWSLAVINFHDKIIKKLHELLLASLSSL